MDHSPVQTRMRLTHSAQATADRNGLGPTLLAATPPGNMLVGDHLLMEHAGQTLRFAVMRRAWMTGPSGWTLEYTLDHPAR